MLDYVQCHAAFPAPVCFQLLSLFIYLFSKSILFVTIKYLEDKEEKLKVEPSSAVLVTPANSVLA